MAAWLWIVALVGCDSAHNDAVDGLLAQAYGYRYRNLDSAMSMAQRCYNASDASGRSRGEALNTMAFVNIARMHYAEAARLLDEVASTTSDDVERAVADIQMMRVCQRQSRNKDFYIYKRAAWEHLNAADNRRGLLTQRQRQRLEYARSEKAIVESAYYYYVGLDSMSRQAIASIDPGGTIAKDTAQLLSYYYYMGSGGLVVDSTPQAVADREFNLLLRCYLLSRQMNFAYWEANAMQGLCEHLLTSANRERIATKFPKEIDFINTGNVSLDSLPADLAMRSRQAFMDYGDTYQTAGACRTLAECLWQSGNYDGALSMLNEAIERDSTIMQAPDLVASICEQFSLTYSALDLKPESDYYRNLFLDMQEQTRQDRKLEARAEQLSASTAQLNMVIAICVIALVVMALAVVALSLWRMRKNRRQLRVQLDEIGEQTVLSEQECLSNKQRNLEQRAKVALVGEITPLINRICHELDMLTERQENANLQKERMDYVAELAAKINEYNAVLTDWIQIRQGRLRLHIESFAINSLFDTIRSGALDVERSGVRLIVEPTDSVVKADRTLTLFMLNTMIDNARRYTHSGDTITVAASECDSYVELSVRDTGDGMTQEKVDSLFNHTAIRKEYDGHGFGLLNCKGIIEHYRKTSQLFAVCDIQAESHVGKGTTVRFRLPKGIRRAMAALLVLLGMTTSGMAADDVALQRADDYADSTIVCNIRGDYRASLAYADSCIFCLNNYYFSLHRSGTSVMTVSDVSASDAAELQWWHDGEPTDFQAILTVRNEMAVAALALHEWDLYAYNNKVYTQLFRLVSTDKTLEQYVGRLKKIETRRNIALMILLAGLFVVLPLCYYLLYRRRKQASLKAQEIIATANDRLRQTEMQRDKYYINNSVMDNCLSTLKHETMFYPSRLCSLIASSDSPDASQLRNIAQYYKEIFWQLSQMAASQTLVERTIDPQMLQYMLQLVEQLGGNLKAANLEKDNDTYSTMHIPFPHMDYDATVAARLFSPSTVDVRFVMLRQAVREIGEKLGARGCGIRASGDSGHTVVNITLTRKIIEQLGSLLPKENN